MREGRALVCVLDFLAEKLGKWCYHLRSWGKIEGDIRLRVVEGGTGGAGGNQMFWSCQVKLEMSSKYSSGDANLEIWGWGRFD